MLMQYDALYNQVLSLPPIERARLVEKLLQSFNSEPSRQEELDATWSREANDRWAACQAGKMKASSAQEVMARIEQTLSQ